MGKVLRLKRKYSEKVYVKALKYDTLVSINTIMDTHVTSQDAIKGLVQAAVKAYAVGFPGSASPWLMDSPLYESIRTKML